MRKINIDSLVKKVLEESLQEKADDLMSKIKSKVNEWDQDVNISNQPGDMTEEDTTPNPEGCKKIKDMIANGGEDTLGKLEEYCGKSAEMEEGNAFSGALNKAKKSGEDKFKVGGKEYPVKDVEMEEQRGGEQPTQDDFKQSTLKLKESEMIDLIERIVIEQKKAKGMAETEKVLSADKKENDAAIKAVTKKMKEYLKGMTKGEYDTNPKHFPKGNGELAKMETMKYNPSEAVEEYIEAFAYPGQTNLTFDEIKPDDERIKKHLEGDATTGNSQEYANAVPSDTGKKFMKNYKENLYGAEQKDASYKRQSQPVDIAGNKSKKGSLKKTSASKAQSILDKVDESKTKEGVVLNEEFGKMKHLMGYNKKTQ
jgi:hypothetical protein